LLGAFLLSNVSRFDWHAIRNTTSGGGTELPIPEHSLGARAMNRSILTLDKASRASRRQEVQDLWSADERRARAEAGKRRRQQLVRILEEAWEPEIWAVGAPGDEDLPRLAG
jgi:hypothetical protein